MFHLLALSAILATRRSADSDDEIKMLKGLGGLSSRHIYVDIQDEKQDSDVMSDADLKNEVELRFRVNRMDLFVMPPLQDNPSQDQIHQFALALDKWKSVPRANLDITFVVVKIEGIGFAYTLKFVVDELGSVARSKLPGLVKLYERDYTGFAGYPRMKQAMHDAVESGIDELSNEFLKANP